MREIMSRVKSVAAALLILPVFAILFAGAAVTSTRASDEDPAATYKAKCAMCHGGKAERFFEPAKTEGVHIEAIMKGVKPKMPSYEAKGMTDEQTKAMVEYMRSLRQQ